MAPGMGRLVGIVLLVLGIYVGVTVATEGVDPLFGGLLASPSRDGAHAAAAPEASASSEPAWGEPAAAEPPRPITTRVRDRVQSAVDERAERLGEY